MLSSLDEVLVWVDWFGLDNHMSPMTLSGSRDLAAGSD